MREISIKTEFIRLDQLLKYCNVVNTGGEAKILIKEGKVKVNGEVILQRGKKIRNRDVIEFNGNKIKVIYEK
ncbi:ribosome-associated protein [Caminicella sporogenes DSM 14501]|uniref:Ribosome-associated protein n=1 Tax=Caminicella sporogenes DSM 14501 TaxID=1121266 RepID=A0A1M6NBZ6_9FIRM|nr:S4 domain-containing protein YaaA [Caminicella sporogenes]RKD22252.1 RNA-binding protein [Caminicella sporogenes]SHJ93245.1 ribosome-associated protein [Caminicella sporogenes DSM 14501]